MKKAFLSLCFLAFAFMVFLCCAPESQSNAYADGDAHISYSSHSQKVGWQEAVTDGTLSGTSGRGLRLEAFRISLTNTSGGISYTCYSKSSGWQKTVSNGSISGTTGQAREISAIRISLTGQAANIYDVYYHVHKSHTGWTSWTKNGTASGSSNSNKIEGIQILLVKKGAASPSSIAENHSITASFQAHVNSIGWQGYTYGAGVAGRTGFASRLEALRIRLNNNIANFGIEYSSFVQDNGWQGYVTNNQISGTTGQRKKIFGLKVRLTGYQSANYNVFYRTYTTNGGWGKWVSNGEVSGNPGASDNVEAFQVSILRKNQGAPANYVPITSVTPITLNYSTHVQSHGWMSQVSNTELSGTVNQAKRMEAIKMNLNGVATSKLGIRYSTHVQTYGWLDAVSNGQVSGTTNQAKRMEAIKIELTGQLASQFDIYYRVHIQTYGWLGWAKNGEIAGSTSLAKRIEAIQISIVPAGTSAPGSVAMPYVSPNSILKGIDVSHYQGSIDWPKVVGDGYSFAMVKVADGDTPAKNYKVQLEGASKVGMYVGAYCYSYAMSVEQAEIEARTTLNAIRGYTINYPIALDLENTSAAYDQRKLSKETQTQMVLAYKKIIEDAGYKFVLYVSQSWLEDRLDYTTLYNHGVKIWVARYLDINKYGNFGYQGGVDNYRAIRFPSDMVVMWQHSETGHVNGITGNVDLDISFGFLNS